MNETDFSSQSADTTLPAPSPDGINARLSHLIPGDQLGERFVIVRFLAGGGMGQVYEAEDLHLQRQHCALKILKPEISTNPLMRARFEREVLLAREVNHPNVCPTHTLFHVDSPSGRIMCLTMKLLDGQSLRARLESGRLDSATALHIARQMADGLEAAHRVSVIHRDFKPGNLMLEGDGSDLRVWITDFGLARAYGSDTTLGETGQILGTPGYIAPELIQGQPATFSADVYAFGVVLYQMVTGRLPFRENGQTTFFLPSRLVPQLAPEWDRAILGCLEFDPALRFRSPREAISILDQSAAARQPFDGDRTKPNSGEVPAIVRRRFLGWPLAGILALAGLIVITLWNWNRVYALLHPLPEKRFVAVLAWPADSNPANGPLLKSALDGIARLGRAEADVKNLLIVSPNDVTGQLPLKAPADVVSALGANLVLAASLRSSESQYALTLRVLDAATSKELREGVVTINASELGLLPDRASAASAALLDIPVGTGQLTDELEQSHVKPAVFQLFSEAEELIAQPNDAGLDQGIEKYQKVLEKDSTFALAYARLSMAYTKKYTRSNDPAVLSLAQKNADLALKLNPDSAKATLSRALVDLYSGNTQNALDGLSRARQLDPGSPQIQMYKALAFRFLDRRTEEEAAYREIISRRPNYWPAYNELGSVLHRHGRDQQAAEAFAEAAAIAPRAALPLTNLGAIDLLLGRKAEAEEAFHKSLERMPTELANLQLGNLAFAENDYRKALDYYEKARELGPRNDITWRNIGDCYAMLGDSAKVAESYAKAADLLTASLRTNPLRGSAWMTLAFYQAKVGRRADAEMAVEQAESRGASDVQSQFKKAQVLALLGRKDEALRVVLECRARGLSETEVELALDLAAVRADPRYRSQSFKDPSK
jgi:tetratricopeptide (TPR) repeat protein